MADSMLISVTILSAILKLKRKLRTERTVFLGTREISPLFHFFGGHLILFCVSACFFIRRSSADIGVGGPGGSQGDDGMQQFCQFIIGNSSFSLSVLFYAMCADLEFSLY